MKHDPKYPHPEKRIRPISGSFEQRGGINTNPSAMLSRPPPPQPYGPAPSKNGGKTTKERS